MNTLIGLLVAALVMLAAHPALAQDKTLAIVVKGLDNPFFEQINLGCQKWNAENKGKGYTCMYTGPASSTDEAGVMGYAPRKRGSPDLTDAAISPYASA